MDNKAIQKNKATIIHLYNILNERKLEELDKVVSREYMNSKAQRGVHGFSRGIQEALDAFGNAHWTIEELIADDGKVIVKQNMSGTHSGAFQGRPATGKVIHITAFIIYRLHNEKIIDHEVQTDRFGFLQQLEVLPPNLLTESSSHVPSSAVYFIDRFRIPANTMSDFLSKTEYNRSFIKTLGGFINDMMISRKDETGDLLVLTIAIWQSEDHLHEAKRKVIEEYRRINFNPEEFLLARGIEMSREQYYAFRIDEIAS